MLAASIFLFYAGMEMNAIHVKEVKDPAKEYPKAILVATLGTVVIFVLGTLAIAFIVPQSKISLTQSLLVAYDSLFAWAGLSWAAPVIAGALACGVLAGIVVWIAGPSSGLLVVGKAGYLPRNLQKTNKHGMGHTLLIFQAATVSILSVLFVVLPSVQSTYQILSQLTVILYLIMYLLMFSAVIYLRYSQPDRPRPYRIPGGKVGLWVVGGAGFVGSLVAFLLSFYPPSQIAIGSSTLYVGLLVVLTAVAVSVPLLIYRARKPGWRDPESDFVPFTWEAEGAHRRIPKHLPAKPLKPVAVVAASSVRPS